MDGNSNANSHTILLAVPGTISPGGFWGDRQRESPRYPRQKERVRETEREEPPDYSHAPPSSPRKDATVKIVVMGDANADWLAYGLEDAFSENTDIGIVRRHRTESGLIRYDQRREHPMAAGCTRDHRG